jgi:RimJ/RimL family protein N-acetyltransferase
MITRVRQMPVQHMALRRTDATNNSPEETGAAHSTGVTYHRRATLERDTDMGIDKPYLLDIPDEWPGERIVVRCWRDDDAQTLYDAVVASKEYIARWLPWPRFYQSMDAAYQFIRGQSGHWSLHHHIGTGIWRREDGALLGSIGITVRDWQVPSFEIGYWLGQMHEGHGYVSEAVRIMTRYLFEELHAERVAILCDARNARSKAVPERLGFVFEGCNRRDSLGTHGEIRDTLTYAMIPEDYARARATWGAV